MFDLFGKRRNSCGWIFRQCDVIDSYITKFYLYAFRYSGIFKSRNLIDETTKFKKAVIS